MNGTDTQPLDAGVEAFAYTPPPFPTWPPPSGGAPVTAPELGPITNPYPYGSPQTANISIAGPAPSHPYKSTFYPQKMPSGATGQNQPQQGSMPVWPHSKVCVLPDKASPLLSQIQPAPRMGPGPQSLTWETGVGRVGPASKTFPVGSWIDGYGNVITPTRVVGGLGN
jgi:hypothetical protein